MSNKQKYNLFTILSIIVSAGCPIWAAIQKFKFINEYSEWHKIGGGMLITVCVLCVTFRKMIFEFIKNKFKITAFPPICGWIMIYCVTIIIDKLYLVHKDFQTVCLAGIIGCALGTSLSCIASIYNRKDESENVEELIKTAVKAEKESLNGEDTTDKS